MFQIGLKVWSINQNYIEDAVRLYEKKVYQYIELYAVPGSYEETHSYWKGLNIPFVIHAPHFGAGMNLARKDQLSVNMMLAEETKRFADYLNSDKIIFHPGVEGQIQETIRQLLLINDSRLIIENKPYFSNDRYSVCNGAFPDEIKEVLNAVKIGFCLDFGHAINAANAKNIDPFELMDQFILLNPVIFHLTDGDYFSIYDTHKQYSTGSFPLREILKKVPENAMITNESLKKSKINLDGFEDEIMILKSLSARE